MIALANYFIGARQVLSMVHPMVHFAPTSRMMSIGSASNQVLGITGPPTAHSKAYAIIIVEREFLFWAAVVEIKPDAIIIEEKNTKDPW